MGKVYLAYDNHLGRKVALKVLPSGFTKDADRVSRFQQEARAASGLNHPNIVTIYELWLGQTGLWEMSMDGGESKQLTARPSAAVSISPDGKWFSCGDFEPTGIRRAIYPIEGGEPRKLIDVSSPYVCWTPDGRALAYLDENHLSNVSSETIEGGVKRQLTDFNSDVIFRFAWSKDGKQLAVARGTLSHDVVLINNFITGN